MEFHNILPIKYASRHEYHLPALKKASKSVSRYIPAGDNCHSVIRGLYITDKGGVIYPAVMQDGNGSQA